MSAVTYTFDNLTIYNERILRGFILTMTPRDRKIYSITYNSTTRQVTVTTKENAWSSDTNTILSTILNQQYPNPPYDPPIETDSPDLSGNATSSISVYGYFPPVSIDGDVIIKKNTSLTRNMYYGNLTVLAGVNLNANGWRIVITETLTLEGTISNDGSDASGVIAGVGTAPMFTTYLGPGTSGGAGLTTSGSGNPGVSATYQSVGGGGGDGGNGTVFYTGGKGGTIMPISPVDGGINTLITMPIAFLGRMISNNFYISGGTGGGAGGCSKGNASTVRSGAGGGAGGFMIIAAKRFVGSGKITAKGGNGSSATWSGSGTQSPGGIGGGGGGGGGCIIVITQGLMPDTITFDVTGGTGGNGISPGKSGTSGDDGKVFIVNV